MSGLAAVVIGFAALIAVTIAVVIYIVRSAIREIENKESRLVETDRQESRRELDDRSPTP